MTQQLVNQLKAYGQWKSKISGYLQRYGQWLEQSDLLTREDELNLGRLQEMLQTDKITIAFLAEFSRGKSELINALFFSDLKRRLLPAEPGRTTMVPTEIFHDEQCEQAYLRLLPIETRSQETSIVQLKQEPGVWQEIPLRLDDAQSMETALAQLTRLKRLPVDQARELGLFDELSLENYLEPPTYIEVPYWRHALLSLPHPALQHGLVLIDTPGLNALGYEPELTLEIVPSAQAIVYLLAADAGVTRSDLEVWQRYVKPLQQGQHKGVMVVLNKIDTLWDELRDAQAVVQGLERQRLTAATTLAVDSANVFLVSAQKGLQARIKQDDALLAQSGLEELEGALCSTLLKDKQRQTRQQVVDLFGEMIRASQQAIARQRKEVDNQLSRLSALRNENKDQIITSIHSTHVRQTRYQVAVESFKAGQSMIVHQVKSIRSIIDLRHFGQLVRDTREEMQRCWTVHGIKREMEKFFLAVDRVMDQMEWQMKLCNDQLGAMFERYNKEHGLDLPEPRLLNINDYLGEFDLLFEEAERLRRGHRFAVWQRKLVTQKFFISLVGSVNALIVRINQELDDWARVVLEPVIIQLEEYRDAVDGYLKKLRTIKSSEDELGRELFELVEKKQNLGVQLSASERYLEMVTQAMPYGGDEAMQYLAETMAHL